MFTGTHGLEGYRGSAILSYLLATRVHGAMAPGDALVPIHAINPWGMAHSAAPPRTTSTSVDYRLLRERALARGPTPESSPSAA